MVNWLTDSSTSINIFFSRNYLKSSASWSPGTIQRLHSGNSWTIFEVFLFFKIIIIIVVVFPSFSAFLFSFTLISSGLICLRVYLILQPWLANWDF